MICMGILCLIYLICSLRTNIVFFLIFFTLVPAFGLLGGTFLNAAQGKAALAAKCQEAAGAFAFVTCLCGWWILLAILLASVDFPLAIPSKYSLRRLWLLLTVEQSATCPPISRVPARRRRNQSTWSKFSQSRPPSHVTCLCRGWGLRTA
jgi:hypothetical protein